MSVVGCSPFYRVRVLDFLFLVACCAQRPEAAVYPPLLARLSETRRAGTSSFVFSLRESWRVVCAAVVTVDGGHALLSSRQYCSVWREFCIRVERWGGRLA